MTHPYFDVDAPGGRILAHRGFVPPGASYADNTRAAIESAVAVGARYIESDCHITKDGVVVLFHDATLSRVAGIEQRVADTTAADLARIMNPLGGLLTLRDALEEYPGLRWNLDVKAAAAAETVGTSVAPHAHRVLLTSFADVRRRRAVAAARREGGAPAVSPGATSLARMVALARLRAVRRLRSVVRSFDALQIPEARGRVRVLTPLLLRAAHEVGTEVHVWTINDERTMRRLIDSGVDGIVTDRLDIAIEAVRATDEDPPASP